MSKITIPIPGAPVVIASDKNGVTVSVDGVVVARTTRPAHQVEHEIRQQIQREEDRQLSIAETDRIIKQLERGKKSPSALLGSLPGGGGDDDDNEELPISGGPGVPIPPLPRPGGPSPLPRPTGLRIIKRRVTS